ncbi:protease modulator HflK [Pelagerythrobacter sp.]|uniref:protease modulator HflK n=1 Tax=Pelagerythrobacter sp. TaxID=2800702 RepID=UPI0035AD9053
MDVLGGLQKRIALAMAGKGPWGGKQGGGKAEDPGEAPGDGSSPGDKPRGPRNPWLPPGGGDEPRRSANIEDIFKHRGPEGPRRRGGGGGGPRFRLPEGPGGRSWFPLAIAAIAAIWLFATSVHQVAPREQGVVTWLGGKYSHTLSSGLNFTLPWPIQMVDVENVSQIRSESIPGTGEEKLILTGDQNLVDLSYLIRWNIKDLKQFRFQLAEPEETIREVAEAAMRASVAEMELDDVLSGAGRADIEARVTSRMQELLDAYRAGVAVQGIEIEKTDPPAEVIEAFKDVSAAQQDAETAVNSARAYAQRVMARAEGDATAFNRIYEEYRLAPQVTRQRLYYETMESVLSKTDKTIIEADGVTPYLPLPEVQRRSAPPPRAPSVTAPEGQ